MVAVGQHLGLHLQQGLGGLGRASGARDYNLPIGRVQIGPERFSERPAPALLSLRAPR